MIRHFVPQVVDQRKLFWESMLAGTPMQAMTTADIAFAFLVLEQHMMQWRQWIHTELETGQTTSPDTAKEFGGLLYRSGIASQEGKVRFETLKSFFYTHFYKLDSKERENNVNRLQNAIAELVQKDTEVIQQCVSNCKMASRGLPMNDLQDDILHRVFYYTHS